MKKIIAKIIYTILIFVLALFLIDHLMNQGNTDLTSEMGPATYPLLYIDKYGNEINPLRGYARKMQERYQNETITPVSSTDRTLKFSLRTFGNSVSNVAYEVRSLDGERLIEDTEIYDLSVNDEGGSADSENASGADTQRISFSITLKDLLEENQNYSLCVKVKNEEGRELYYYTRIRMQSEECHLEEQLSFVKNFHECIFDKSRATEITKYLESNSDGDNSSFAKVNIHSSFSQMTWGILDVKIENEPEYYIRQINPYVCQTELRYIVSVKEGINTHYYNVKEYYFTRFGKERMYLLDYERSMNSIFLAEGNVYTNNKINMSITDANIDLKESEDGNIFAFVKEGRIYSFNQTDSKIALLFGFYDEKNKDDRCIYNNADIKILSVDETGNVRFLVYGYMDRGEHEGCVGVACYYYNGTLNTVEEEVFIPTDVSVEMLRQNVNQLGYVNAQNQLFVLLEGNLYKVDLEMKTYETIAENLSIESIKVSKSNKMVCWQNSEDKNKCTKMTLMNLNTGKQQEITASSSQYLKPLGFMNEDLIYGIAYMSDVSLDQFGQTVFPMYSVRIQDETGKILKNYEKSGVYVTQAVVDHNQILLTRVTAYNNDYMPASSDQIMDDNNENTGKNIIEQVATQDYENIVQIAAKTKFNVSKLKYLTPKQVIYEGQRSIMISMPNEEKGYYYVYDKYGLKQVLTDANEAVTIADASFGVVLNDRGDYVWEKAARSLVNQIMKIKAEPMDEEKSTLAVCLDTMLGFEGNPKNTQPLLDQGQSIMRVLEEGIPDSQILKLSGCSLNSVLYYVGKDIPVLCILNDGNAVLIVGYNELNTVIYNPASGTIAKMGMNDSADYFSSNGNNFITYVRKSSK